MGSSYAQGLFLMLTASMLAVSMANPNVWPFKNGTLHQNNTQGPKKIIVGGTEHWHYNFSYTDWARKNGPFYFNDTLVFKYDPPSNTTFPHSVYLLRDLWSFIKCDLRGAKRVANVTQGGGEGFEFVLKKWQPHYFACGEHNGGHCKDGMMKFFVMPLFRSFHG